MKRLFALLVLVLLASLAGCGGTQEPAVQPTQQPAVQPTSVPATAAAQPTTVPSTDTPRPPESLGLTVEEYPIASHAVDQPTHFEYLERIPPEVLDKRRAWREPTFEQRAAEANQVLAPFGYRLQFKPEADGKPQGYDLYKDEELILADIAFFHTPQVTADGKDMIMLVEPMSSLPILVRPDRGDVWDSGKHGYVPPVLAGSELVSVNTEDNSTYVVKRGNETLYTAGPFQPGPENPIKTLAVFDDQWILEVDGQVIGGGHDLNQEMGYDEIFGYRVVGGQPLFFFNKEGRVGIWYAGQELPYQYIDVIHYACCEQSAFNVQGNEDMVWFHGLRDGTWYYVEAGVYQ